jgi:hypothetical protein
MSPDLDFPRPLVFDEDYWLCRCHGFRVETASERVGVVADVRFGSRLDRPDELVVQGGLFGSRVVVISVSEVVEVMPRKERIILRPRSRPEGREPLARLRAHLTALLNG